MEVFCFGFLIFVGLYFLYRLVQWWQMVQQLKSEGRDIREEMKRLSKSGLEDK